MNVLKDYRLGVEVIGQMIPMQYPLIMVDNISSFDPQNKSLEATKYISGNENVFLGHFPNLKLWPGIYSLEGIRQCFQLQFVLDQINQLGQIDGLIELQRSYQFQPMINDALCSDARSKLQMLSTNLPEFKHISAKFLHPVFAGCTMKYHLKNDSDGTTICDVTVDDKLTTRGSITKKPGA